MNDFLLQHAEDDAIFGDGAMDVVIDKGGQVALVESKSKLQLELLKTCLTGKTTIDGNGYGSTLPRLIGTKQYYAQGNFLQSVAGASVESAIQNYKVQQSSSVPDDEKILRLVGSARAQRDSGNPTIISIAAVVETVSGDSVEVQYSLIGV